MNVQALIAAANNDGVQLWYVNGKVGCAGEESIVEHYMSRLAECKAELVEALQAVALQEDFEERAAIMQVDGGLSSCDAAHAAAERVYGRRSMQLPTTVRLLMNRLASAHLSLTDTLQ